MFIEVGNQTMQGILMGALVQDNRIPSNPNNIQFQKWAKSHTSVKKKCGNGN